MYAYVCALIIGSVICEVIILQVATWMEGNETIQAISPIRWCSQQDTISIKLCQGVSNTGCSTTKKLPPRALINSPYQYDYSNYNFDVVTIEVSNGDDKE